jgi:hypothetical protein
MEIALVHNNSLILGPMGYNVRMINSELEDLEVVESITPQSYTEIPIHFSDGLTHLLPLEKEIPSHDPKYHNIGNFTWEIIEENNIPSKVKLTYPIIDKTLDEVKYIRKQEVKPERRRREDQVITLTINNMQVEVSTGREERSQFVNKLVSCLNIQNASHNYKFRNDVWVVIGCAEIGYILEQIDHTVQEAFNWEIIKLEEIDACATIDDVYAVEISPIG